MNVRLRRWHYLLVVLLAAVGLAAATLPRFAEPHTSGTDNAPTRPDSRSEQSLRSRYGVILGDGDAAQVTALGLEWFIHWHQPTEAPVGTSIVSFLPASPVLDEATLREYVQRFPGSYWLLGNEPNLPLISHPTPTLAATPEQYADALAWYASVLKAIDPEAKLIGPNVLHWTSTCAFCPGYQIGREWTERMREAYRARFSTEPPLDVWSLHAYDLDWSSLPQGDAQRQIEQIQALRDWLDETPALRGHPIWVTEVGIHWGYPGFERREDWTLHPVGEFDYEHVERYMRTIFGWLNENAERQNIEKWFLYVLSQSYAEYWQSQWAGITLMDGPAADAPINRLGRVYQELAGIR